MELGIESGPFAPELDKYFLEDRKVCELFHKGFVAMLPEGLDLSFAEKHSLDKVIVGIDSSLIHSFFLALRENLRTEYNG